VTNNSKDKRPNVDPALNGRGWVNQRRVLYTSLGKRGKTVICTNMI